MPGWIEEEVRWMNGWRIEVYARFPQWSNQSLSTDESGSHRAPTSMAGEAESWCELQSGLVDRVLCVLLLTWWRGRNIVIKFATSFCSNSSDSKPHLSPGLIAHGLLLSICKDMEYKLYHRQLAHRISHQSNKREVSPEKPTSYIRTETSCTLQNNAAVTHRLVESDAQTANWWALWHKATFTRTWHFDLSTLHVVHSIEKFKWFLLCLIF